MRERRTRTINVNTKAFIIAMVEKINSILPTTYEEAPAISNFPYAVLSGINIIDLASGDLTSFYIDIWTDEKKDSATEELEELCDKLRNSLNGSIISENGVFYAHISFENQNGILENEFDISHRRISMTARIFYI